MSFGNDWNGLRGERSRLEIGSMGVLRVALLFGAAAVAFALIIAPLVDGRVSHFIAGTGAMPDVDLMATGTVASKGSYTIRKSVLQSTPDAVCILRSNGTSTGDCAQ